MESSHTARRAGDLWYAVGIAAVAVVVLAWAGPSSAGANEFTINACQADRGEFSTQAFEDFANRGMMWKRACDPEGPGLRGLVTANVVRAPSMSTITESQVREAPLRPKGLAKSKTL